MADKPLLLVGQVFLDVTASDGSARLGGVVHAARALSALGESFHCLYIAPGYLDDLVANRIAKLGGTCERIGAVVGAPNVFLIGDPKEVGHQGYVGLLQERQQFSLQASDLTERLSKLGASEALIFPDPPYVEELLEALLSGGIPVSVDGGLPLAVLRRLQARGHRLDCLMVSTSHEIFAQDYAGDPARLRSEVVPSLANSVLLKENRGGCRYWREDEPLDIPAQVRPVSHSIGVGDCFSASFLILRRRYDERTALDYCSWLASEYAACQDSATYAEAASRCLALSPEELVAFPGVRVPWEERPEVNVYLAGPDFTEIDTSSIDTVADALGYHNFRPRLPIRENGRAEPSASPAQRAALARKDLDLLHECQMLVAVLPFDDPGTLMEIGAGVERRMPVLVYSSRTVSNLMLERLPTLVTDDLDELIGGVFRSAARLREGRAHGS